MPTPYIVAIHLVCIAHRVTRTPDALLVVSSVADCCNDVQADPSAYNKYLYLCQKSEMTFVICVGGDDGGGARG